MNRKALYEFLFEQMLVATDTSSDKWAQVVLDSSEGTWQHAHTGALFTVKVG